MSLTRPQQKLVSRLIKQEHHLKKEALAKSRAGKKLSRIELRRTKRPREQLIRIGYERARKIDEDIPEYEE
jgi:hypothetical protein